MFDFNPHSDASFPQQEDEQIKMIYANVCDIIAFHSTNSEFKRLSGMGWDIACTIHTMMEHTIVVFQFEKFVEVRVNARVGHAGNMRSICLRRERFAFGDFSRTEFLANYRTFFVE